MMSMSLNDIAILNIHGVDYRCIISGTRHLLENVDLSRKDGSL